MKHDVNIYFTSYSSWWPEKNAKWSLVELCSPPVHLKRGLTYFQSCVQRERESVCVWIVWIAVRALFTADGERSPATFDRTIHTPHIRLSYENFISFGFSHSSGTESNLWLFKWFFYCRIFSILNRRHSHLFYLFGCLSIVVSGAVASCIWNQFDTWTLNKNVCAYFRRRISPVVPCAPPPTTIYIDWFYSLRYAKLVIDTIRTMWNNWTKCFAPHLFVDCSKVDRLKEEIDWGKSFRLRRSNECREKPRRLRHSVAPVQLSETNHHYLPNHSYCRRTW